MGGPEYLELKREASASRVHTFPDRYDDSLQSNVPADHREKFRCIQSLGDKKFDNYASEPTMNATSGPWQRERKATAAKIHSLARKCRSENRNEDGWRSEIEPLVFQRFDVEVTCSDIGTREIFTTRIGEAVFHRRADPEAGKPIKQQPDRIFGLSETLILERLLRNPYPHGDRGQHRRELVREVVKTSINPENGGSPLLFPFLVLEAKAGKGAHGFEHIEAQSALPIMEALRLQYDLMKTRGNTVEVPGGPLVWSIATRGDDWRIYAGYVIENEGLPHYFIKSLWGGCITDRNHALQLLLIIDCIVDWARDTFRPNILLQIKMLRSLGPIDPSSFMVNEDIYSVLDCASRVGGWINSYDAEIIAEEEQDSEHCNRIPNDDKAGNIEHLHKVETAHGLVRDARKIESQLLGLVITEANFQAVMDSFDTEVLARQFSRDVLSVLNQRHLILENQNALDKIGDLWTGRSSFEQADVMHEDTKIFVQFRGSYFIDHEWNQVRQLNYLVVTEEVLPRLLARAEIRQPRQLPNFDTLSSPYVTERRLRIIINKLLKQTVRYEFTHAICRRTFTLHGVDTEVTLADGNGFTRTTRRPRVQIRPDSGRHSPGVQMQDLVHSTHERFRIGHHSVIQPFLVTSSRVHFKPRVLWTGYQIGDSALLVYGKLPKIRPHLSSLASEQNLCLYIMDGATPDLESVSKDLDSSPFRDVYRTVRRDRTYTTSLAAQENMEDEALWLVELDDEPEFIQHENLHTVDYSIKCWREELSKRFMSGDNRFTNEDKRSTIKEVSQSEKQMGYDKQGADSCSIM
ncbi:MAG: hypothetical protein M1821_001021 [Bathelium mastoideum]|nr:MAG: hypothetical protein M1821_001021 [Bathelium mastoideum]